MKFDNRKIFKVLAVICLISGIINKAFAYNLDSFDLIYETDTTITKNIFNGANFKCSADNSVGELFYFINTSENFNTVIKFVENEFSGHVNLKMHTDGMKVVIAPSDLTSSNEELKDGMIVFTLKIKDQFPGAHYPDVTLILNETKDADHDAIRTCITNLKNLQNAPATTPATSTSATPATTPATTTSTTTDTSGTATTQGSTSTDSGATQTQGSGSSTTTTGSGSGTSTTTGTGSGSGTSDTTQTQQAASTTQSSTGQSQGTGSTQTQTSDTSSGQASGTGTTSQASGTGTTDTSGSSGQAASTQTQSSGAGAADTSGTQTQSTGTGAASTGTGTGTGQTTQPSSRMKVSNNVLNVGKDKTEQKIEATKEEIAQIPVQTKDGNNDTKDKKITKQLRLD